MSNNTATIKFLIKIARTSAWYASILPKSSKETIKRHLVNAEASLALAKSLVVSEFNRSNTLKVVEADIVYYEEAA